MQHRRARAATWAQVDPVLPFGVLGIELADSSPYLPTGVQRLGNGEHHWSELPSWDGSSPPTYGIRGPGIDGTVLVSDASEDSGSKWRAPLPMPLPRSAAGGFITPAWYSSTTAAFSALGRLYLQPIDLGQAIAFDGIGTSLTVAAVGGTSPAIRMGVYPDDGTYARPTSTPIAGTTTNYDPTSGTGDLFTAWGANVTMFRRVWLAWMLVSGSAFGTNPTAVACNYISQMTLPNLGNNNSKVLYVSNSGSLSALPDLTGATFSLAANAAPIMGLRAA